MSSHLDDCPIPARGLAATRGHHRRFARGETLVAAGLERPRSPHVRASTVSR